MKAAQNNQFKALVLLLQSNTPDTLLGEADEEGYTVLHCAVKAGCKELTEKLLGMGVDPNATTKGGFSPLHIAIRENQEEIALLLLKDTKEDVLATARTHKGHTPLYLLLVSPHEYSMELVKQLLLKEVRNRHFYPGEPFKDRPRKLHLCIIRANLSYC